MTPGQAFVRARVRARAMSTRKLRRVERTFRAIATGSHGSVLDRQALASWAAARAELRDRGLRLPETDQRPRWRLGRR